MRMMIVDDSRMIRMRISRMIEDRKIDNIEVVALADNGATALQLAIDTKPNIVTMDLTMPEMDGVECIKALVTHDASIRILVVSALDDKSTAITALKNGARGFLAKPFSDDQLHQALLEIIDAN